MCFVSGRTDHIQLHHLRYDNVLEEPDEDLVPLHAYYHKLGHHLVKKRKVKLETVHFVMKECRLAFGSMGE